VVVVVLVVLPAVMALVVLPAAVMASVLLRLYYTTHQ